jgi:hypothetical protein
MTVLVPATMAGNAWACDVHPEAAHTSPLLCVGSGLNAQCLSVRTRSTFANEPTRFLDDVAAIVLLLDVLGTLGGRPRGVDDLGDSTAAQT